jgi:hypothetical protein
MTERAMQKAREAASNIGIRFYAIAGVELSISIAYLVLADQEKAIETLENLNKQECAQFINRERQFWPFFDRLRGNPRFEKLLED